MQTNPLTDKAFVDCHVVTHTSYAHNDILTSK